MLVGSEEQPVEDGHRIRQVEPTLALLGRSLVGREVLAEQLQVADQ